MRKKIVIFAGIIALTSTFWSPLTEAKELKTYNLKIKNHRFEPAEINVAAGEKFKLIVENLDETPEEFESYELKREKIIAANSTAQIYISPLKPGEYEFMGEFHQDTAQGKIIVT